jgi:hypothetical protein
MIMRCLVRAIAHLMGGGGGVTDEYIPVVEFFSAEVKPRNLQCHFVHHKTQLKLPGAEPGSPW